MQMANTYNLEKCICQLICEQNMLTIKTFFVKWEYLVEVVWFSQIKKSVSHEWCSPTLESFSSDNL